MIFFETFMFIMLMKFWMIVMSIIFVLSLMTASHGVVVIRGVLDNCDIQVVHDF